ncbi:MAG: peptide MFS transporter [Pseudomonadaceae bacterium]|nr:peptide MFS transporter [Pseudomonadaceae bacterium]
MSEIAVHQRVAQHGMLLGHPKGLFVLFFAEMWERFSYYGMRALLIFYLTQHFLFSDDTASGIYATYGSMVYLMPLFGGLIADRYLGFRRAITFGAVLLCVGHFGMAFEGAPAVRDGGDVVRDEGALQIFYLSLAFIIIGVGFLKPNISGIVGQLYPPNDARRDGGFTIFYMGINLGAATASIVCGYLGQTYGWRYGFGLAGIGMLAGLITFVRWRHLYAGAGEAPAPLALSKPVVGGLSQEWLIYLLGLVAVVVVWRLVQFQATVGYLLAVSGISAVVGVLAYSVFKLPAAERNRMFGVILLTCVSVVFWMLFEQAGTSMSLFTDRIVDRELFGSQVQASQFQSLNPVYIILLAPVFAVAWVWLAQRGWEPSTPAKFGLGVVQVGLGFYALVLGIDAANSDGLVAVGWLALAYLLHTTGELCLSPVGLSMVTRFSAARLIGLMMGIWFLASAAAHYLAGLIAARASLDTSDGIDRVSALGVYRETFWELTVLAVAIGLAVLFSSPLIKRLFNEDEPER